MDYPHWFQEVRRYRFLRLKQVEFRFLSSDRVQIYIELRHFFLDFFFLKRTLETGMS